MLVLDNKMLFPKNAYCGIDRQQIVYLVPSAKRKGKFRLSDKDIHSGNVAGNNFRPSGSTGYKCCIKFIAFVEHHRKSFLFLPRRSQKSASRAQNSAFFFGNFCNGIAKNFRMVKSDSGYNLQNWFRNGVCCVESSAKSCFEHHKIAIFFRKPEHCAGGGNFKCVEHDSLLKEGVRLFFYRFDDFYKALSADHFSVYHHSFTELEHVGRDVSSGFITGGAQNGREHCNS